MNNLEIIILIVAGIILAPILWPIVKFVSIVIILGLIALIVYSLIAANKKRDEIAQNPKKYFDNQNKDVIDVEYQEREVKENDQSRS